MTREAHEGGEIRYALHLVDGGYRIHREQADTDFDPPLWVQIGWLNRGQKFPTREAAQEYMRSGVQRCTCQTVTDAGKPPTCSECPERMPAADDLAAARAQNCQRAYAYAVVSGKIKLVLGAPILGAIGIDWALSTEEARKLRDDLTRALEAGYAS